MVSVIGVTKRLYAAETLDDLILKSVDTTLKQVFKEIGANVIYDYLENHFGLKREEIAEKLEVLSAGLESLLGSAAFVVEQLILKNLYSKLGLEYEEKEGYDFSDYVEELKRGITEEPASL